MEMMGCAPISVNEIPEGFDIRNASLSDLKRLRQGNLTPSELKVGLFTQCDTITEVIGLKSHAQ